MAVEMLRSVLLEDLDREIVINPWVDLTLKAGLQGEGDQELINIWLNLNLIHVGHWDYDIPPRSVADIHYGSLY